MTQRTQEFDFLVLGAGLGGMAAAIRAHDLGLKTIVLEKSDQLGGVAAYSSGYQWCAGNHMAAAAGIEDSWEEGFEYLKAYAGGSADDHLLEVLCRTAPEAVQYFDEHAGVRWALFSDPDNRWPDLPGSKEKGRCFELEPINSSEVPDELREIVRKSIQTDLYTNEEVYWKMGGRAHRHRWDEALGLERQAKGIRYQGFALAAYFVNAIHARGIPMHTNVEVREVLSDDGRVSGVIAVIDGREQRILASRGVLVAMGGYDWNVELNERFDRRSIIGSSAPRSVTGDHFFLLEHLKPGVFGFPRQAAAGILEPEGFKGDTRARYQAMWSSFPHAIVVNERGERFGTEEGIEGAGTRSVNSGMFQADGTALNWPAFAVFDDFYRSNYQIGRTRPGEELPIGFVSAPTVAELADLLGIDRQGLVKTVERYNEHAVHGKDPEFGAGENVWAAIHYGDVFAKPSMTVGPLDTPPFYGVQLVQTAGASLIATGLMADDRARVLNEDGEVIPGLYATGNSMAFRDMGRHYHSGTANMRNMTWAYIAAGDAAGVGVGETVGTARA